MNEILLEVKNLRTQIETRRGSICAVDDVSFSLKKGQIFALLGESGCGKSMTALSIMRLLPAHGHFDGQLLLEGKDIANIPEVDMRCIRGKRIAMIFQEPMTSLNPVLSIGQQIREAVRRHQHLHGDALYQEVIRLLDAVQIPAARKRIDEYPHQLSGGMKQRIMIAIALAGKPEILIADEPTTALDVTIQAQILELLKELQQQSQLAILFITHDLGIVANVADEVAVMYAGQIVEQAPCQEFFEAASHPYSRKLFQSVPQSDKRHFKLAVIPGMVPPLTQRFDHCRFEPRCHYAFAPCKTHIPQWVELTGKHGLRCHLYDAAVAETKPLMTKDESNFEKLADAERKLGVLLDVKELKTYFPIRKGILQRVVGQVYAVDGVSLSIGYGQTLALVGESGCGKTTVGKSILQLIKPTAGKINFENQDVSSFKGEVLRKMRRHFQIIFQDPYSSMNPRMLVGDLIEEGLIAQGIGGDSRERQLKITQLLTQVGLPEDAVSRYPHEFSGGQRQRICIARVLAVEPKLIVCDEPTSALDVSVQAQILNLLQDLQRKLQLSYLFITHNIAVVSYLAHEVAVMYLGRVVERGTVLEVLQNPMHPYTKALLSAVPTVDLKNKKEILRLTGDLPSPINPPSGCHFHPRCPHAFGECKVRYPKVYARTKTHSTACHLFE